jgi:hypothetical protein
VNRMGRTNDAMYNFHIAKDEKFGNKFPTDS